MAGKENEDQKYAALPKAVRPEGAGQKKQSAETEEKAKVEAKGETPVDAEAGAPEDAEKDSKALDEA